MVKIVFLGTKGEIEEYSKKHKYHTSTLLIEDKFKLLIDYGILQKKTIQEIRPNAILITHAHPDHYVFCFKENKTKIPVYLLKNTLDYGKFKPNNFKIIKLKKFRLRNLSIVPFKVLHSLKCDSVGFKIILKKFSIIYTGDVLNIPNKKILEGVDYYIGDGSSIRANLIRRKGNKKFGHARITTQIEWCKNAGIKNIIFTHLGKETIKYEKEIKNKYGIILAHDGMEIKV